MEQFSGQIWKYSIWYILSTCLNSRNILVILWRTCFPWNLLVGPNLENMTQSWFQYLMSISEMPPTLNYILVWLWVHTWAIKYLGTVNNMNFWEYPKKVQSSKFPNGKYRCKFYEPAIQSKISKLAGKLNPTPENRLKSSKTPKIEWYVFKS